MKKLFTEKDFKLNNKRKILKSIKKLKNENLKKKKNKKKIIKKENNNIYNEYPLIPPKDLRLLNNTNECLQFFAEIKDKNNIYYINNKKRVKISLEDVSQIDYGSISILIAINDYLKYNKILLIGNLPFDKYCKNLMIDSGYLNNLYDSKGNKFKKSEKSDTIFFEKGTGFFSKEYIDNLRKLIKKTVLHLTGNENDFQPLETIFLELCGNAIEWGGYGNKLWLLGVNYQNESVIFTVTDIGKGILKTLYINYENIMKNLISNKTPKEILLGAFQQKYGSTTKETNRNKGLPAIKDKFDKGFIINLKVITNNVILHFDNDILSKNFKKGERRFNGTFYQWEINKDCLNKMENN